MYYIKGYKVSKVSIKRVESIITEAKKLIGETAVKRYNELLSREIEMMVDNITLGVIPKPEDTIFQASADSLNKRIAYSSARGENTEYCLSASANILTYKNDTYIELCCATSVYDRVFEKIDGIEDYSISEEEADEKPEVWQVWRDIMKKYSHDSVLTMKLFPISSMPEPNFEDLHFDSPAVRAEKRARYYVTNALLGAYSCGEQIMPYQLMDYMDFALLRGSDIELLPVSKAKTEELKRILINITPEVIY